jgi:hypothetical protein
MRNDTNALFSGLAGVAGTLKRECHRVRMLHSLLAIDPWSAPIKASIWHGTRRVVPRPRPEPRAGPRLSVG